MTIQSNIYIKTSTARSRPSSSTGATGAGLRSLRPTVCFQKRPLGKRASDRVSQSSLTSPETRPRSFLAWPRGIALPWVGRAQNCHPECGGVPHSAEPTGFGGHQTTRACSRACMVRTRVKSGESVGRCCNSQMNEMKMGLPKSANHAHSPSGGVSSFTCPLNMYADPSSFFRNSVSSVGLDFDIYHLATSCNKT